MKRTLSNCRPDKLLTPYEIQPISKGGTGGTTKQEVIANLDLIPKSLLGQPNGILAKVNGKIPRNNIVASSYPTISGPSNIGVSVTSKFIITNYDFSKSYQITSTNNVTVSRINNEIFVTPSTTGNGSITVTENDKASTISFVITNTTIAKPSFISPTNGQLNVDANLTLLTSAPQITGDITHLSTDWEVAKIAPDFRESNLVFKSYEDSINKTSIKLTNTLTNTGHYVRFRYRGSDGSLSSWSNSFSYKTKLTFLTNTISATLTGINRTPLDEFGMNLSMSANGITVMVGAWGSNNGRGSVYVFIKGSSSTWILQSIIDSPLLEAARFGVSTSLDSTGTIAIIGAYSKDNNKGGAYIARKDKVDPSKWILTELTYSGLSVGDNYGVCVSISPNASAIAIGAWQHNGGKGAVHVYTSADSGVTYTHRGILQHSDVVAGDNFGIHLTLNLSGNLLLIGAQGVDNKGAAYLYERIGDEYLLKQQFKPSDLTTGANFGVRVSMNLNSTVLAITAWKDDICGSCYIYSNINGVFELINKVRPEEITDPMMFGASVAIDNNILVIGAWFEDSGKGAVYSYSVIDNKFEFINKLTAPVRVSGDHFGRAVTFITGKPILIGAEGTDDIRGAVYVVA